MIDFLGDFVRLGVSFLELIRLGAQGVERHRFFIGQRLAFARDMPQAVGVAVREIRRDLDPFPALGADGLRLAFEFFGDETVQ